MTNAMSEIKATATAHMRNDLETGAKWVCDCEACANIRALIGLDRTLEVRPLVRAIQDAGGRLETLSPGPERTAVLEQYLGLHDKLAEVMAG